MLGVLPATFEFVVWGRLPVCCLDLKLVVMIRIFCALRDLFSGFLSLCVLYCSDLFCGVYCV